MRILVAVDNSEFALKALHRAIDLAKQQNAELTVMSVALEFQDVDEVPVGHGEKIEDQALRAVRKARRLAEEAGIVVKTRIEVGTSPAENIVRLAEQRQADLIVIGHRGVTGLERFLVGGVAGRVVTHAPCSVMVVR